MLLSMQSSNRQKRFSALFWISKLVTTYISGPDSSCKPKTTLTALYRQPYTYVTNFRRSKEYEYKHNKKNLIQTDRKSVTTNQKDGRRRKICRRSWSSEMAVRLGLGDFIVMLCTLIVKNSKLILEQRIRCLKTESNYFNSAFLWKILVDVKFRISINIFSHNQHTLCVLYYVATSFDPETGSPSDHDKRICIYTETKYKNMHVHRN
jgi:hypothetical protein